MNLGSSLNFYKMPKTIFYQGLSFQDIFVTGLTNQFLSAGFLVLAILSLTKKNHIRTAFLISLSILSHFIFGLVIVLLCTVKMAFDRDFKNLLKIGIICFGLTAFFIVPLYIYKDFMITQVAMPFKTGFWLSMVAVLFLLFKSKNFSYHLSFSALLLVSFIGLAKILNKFNFPYPNFHYYRLLYPSLLLSLFAVAFFLNEAHAKWKKVMLTGIFSLAWFGNFGGHFYAADIFTAYIPEFESISPPSQSDFGKGRTYFFGIGRPVDFAAEINTRINEQRLFFVKGLYWESAQANKLISSVIYKLMGPPTVLEGMGEKTFETKSCEFFKCAFKSLMNITSVSEIWMPPKETLLKYFELGIPERKKFLSCYDDLLNSLEAPSGQLKFSAMIQNRYINRDTAIVKPVDRRNSETTIDAITERCEANPNDDGRIDEINLPSIHRNFSGNYVLNLPVHLAEYHVSLQYFPGLKYDTGKSKGLVPVQSKSGVIIQGSETVHLYYERTWIMWFAYVITALSVTSGLIALVVTSAKSSHSDK
ncbi:hypothetical protein HW988_18090 [Bdellovibrio sp. KM01]|nr:hypothetical protein HW988_18090 [Bdellovibrio sp. KM01]